mmetsp:Transcript_21607/g.41219  ORF Transcript_21607/g.41219 Transcript_21607/m.41219 type:complete len:218 (-) Transcript_21607:83-736(-)|eukprot:CAMPEP_0114253638 /NCGR_PEP_ID=MMETSP0058-20121206/16503_1 /TAXON_ID=36894 /ORGANISM="Pyramimonas parkeae, CCMP726" /LENGTH=217 /DNA_ID=CAMNT_0001367705 /DNA_START=52 /DNA_END=705 /DNA_ORIENTATION=-
MLATQLRPHTTALRRVNAVAGSNRNQQLRVSVRAGPRDAPLGIFFATGTNTTKRLADQLKEKLGDLADEPQEIRAALPTEISEYHGVIFGGPSYMWEQGRVSGLDFDTMEAPISNLQDLKDKKFAVFGTGDQEGYPDNFCDATAALVAKLEARGGSLVGETLPDGYTYKNSRALYRGKHVGLLIDNVNQSDKTEARVTAWAEQLTSEFGLSLWVKPE